MYTVASSSDSIFICQDINNEYWHPAGDSFSHLVVLRATHEERSVPWPRRRLDLDVVLWPAILPLRSRQVTALDESRCEGSPDICVVHIRGFDSGPRGERPIDRMNRDQSREIAGPVVD